MTRIGLRSGLATSACGLAATLALLSVAGCGGGGDGNGNGGAASVTLTASPATITLGESSTLTWSSNSGTSCTASGAWSGAKPASGTESVTPDAVGAASYSISCSGGTYSTPGTASVTVTVDAASAFSKTALVADTAGVGAPTTDANLVNPWGIAFGPTSPAWVANNHSQTSTVYDGNGKPQPLATPIVARLPPPGAGVDFAPTGIVFNGTTDFVVSAAGNSGPARFIFAGESGALAGWSSTVDAANAVVTYVDAAGAAYTGLALASDAGANFLYAADFANGKIDVFDASFTIQAPTANRFGFADPTLPADYHPFNVQALPTGAGGVMQLYVAYARQVAGDEQAGAGLGLVDVFDTAGVFVRRLVSEGGALDAPWGFALAPSDVGDLSGTLLVGNFGDGRINGFDPATGNHVGTVADSSGTPIAMPGLWGIAFGNDRNNQPHATLFYAAGTNGEVSGEFGRIDLGDPPALNMPPDVEITAPAAGNVSGTVTVSATPTGSINVAAVEFFAGTTSLGTDTTAPYSVSWDTTQVADGAVALTASATDVDGNIGHSVAVQVTVANAAPAAATLSELQTLVFTPMCSSCHDGSNPPGGALPGSQDLRAGHSYASLVNVASLERPALMRVQPGNSANSYVIHKLEGAASIAGARMPLGGPFLDAATMDKVRSWIDSGAPNN